MYNNLAKEMTIMKSFMYSPPSIQQKQNIVFSTIPNDVVESKSYKKIIVMDKIMEEDELKDEDEDDDDEDEDEDEDEDDNNANEKKESEYLPIESIDLEFESFSEETNTKTEPIQVLKLDSEPEFKSFLEKKETEPIQVFKLEAEAEAEAEAESKVESEPISYTKLNLNELKALVISKGLITNSNKMKRAELLKLLEEEENRI
jgi:hypothetical protein